MKRVASALAAACALALAALVAPALSLERWRPEPVDFELAAPSGEAGFSAPVRAPKRFNLVGMRWRGGAEPGIWVRVRRSGDEWSRWVPMSAHAEDGPDPGREGSDHHGVSSPVWTGEADEVQYRLTRRVAGLRLHFVNVRGTATAADRARTALRGAVNAAVAPLQGGDAAAREPQPGMVPRSGWGADACPPRSAPDYGSVKAAFVHHTVSANDYAPEEAPGIVLAICRYHRNSNGWDDIGYNFLVDKYGVLYEGRAGGIDQAVVGAQAQGYNSQTTGVANIGTYSTVPQSSEALDGMARLIRWKLPLHGAPTAGAVTLVSAGGSTNRYPAGSSVQVQRVLGHQDTNATECPGGTLYDQLPELRRRVGNVAPAGRATSLSATLSRGRVRYGADTVLSGRLATLDGSPVAGAPVAVEALRGRRFARVGQVVTAVDGSFSAPLRPRGTRVVRARFTGQGDLVPSVSPRSLVSVLARLRVGAGPKSARRGRRVRIGGSVAPRKRLVWQVLELRRRGRFARVGVRALRAKRGRFRGSFVPAGRGLYRFSFVTRPDAATARSRSRRVLLPVR